MTRRRVTGRKAVRIAGGDADHLTHVAVKPLRNVVTTSVGRQANRARPPAPLTTHQAAALEMAQDGAIITSCQVRDALGIPASSAHGVLMALSAKGLLTRPLGQRGWTAAP